MIKVLFLAANPMNMQRLDLRGELNEIDLALRLADPTGENFAIVQRWQVQPGDLLTLLLRHQPQIIHFSGHATDGRLLYFTDADENAHAVDGKTLKELLVHVGSQVQCVVLNACYSKSLADAISETATVVGMTSDILDAAAKDFASAFYQTIGAGKSIKDAVEVAKAEIKLKGYDERNKPILKHKKGEDNAGELLVKPTVRGTPSIIQVPVSERIASYRDLVRRLKLLARYDGIENLSVFEVKRISEDLRDWYFDGGWLFLTDECRIPYFDLKDALKDTIEGAPRSEVAGKSVDKENMALIVRSASTLRNCLRASLQ